MIPRVTTLDLRTGPLVYGDVTHVMAVINLSPESKNAHSVAADAVRALEMAKRYRDLGATVIDLGGQSSHYENPTISSSLELERILPALDLLVDGGFVVSFDTWKPAVAAACVDHGAVLVNDTGGLADPAMRDVAARPGVGAFVMYIEGEHPHAVEEIGISDRKAEETASWMQARLDELARWGVTETVVDPGISINYPGDYESYTTQQLAVIRDVGVLRSLGRPVLIPIPRKREDHRVAAYITMALEYGADMIRVHDVAEACDLVELFGRSPGG